MFLIKYLIISIIMGVMIVAITPIHASLLVAAILCCGVISSM